MLNSGGGIILFDCTENYRLKIVKGCCITEKMKEEYEQRVNSYLKEVRPDVADEVRVSFVPIKAALFSE